VVGIIKKIKMADCPPLMRGRDEVVARRNQYAVVDDQQWSVTIVPCVLVLSLGTQEKKLNLLYMTIIIIIFIIMTIIIIIIIIIAGVVIEDQERVAILVEEIGQQWSVIIVQLIDHPSMEILDTK